ncbi:MAG: hypothetical protein JNL69_09535 [Bacteroidia bacterium]|nr:hypothetical protein [Bacteroidia bacterium]
MNNPKIEPAKTEEVLPVFEKAINWFLITKSYRVNITFNSYLNHTSTVSHDKAEGYYKRDGNNFSSSAMGVHALQNDRIRITVDSINQLIVINNKSEVSQIPVDISSFSMLLEMAVAIKKQKSDNGLQTFKIELDKNNLYKSYEFTVNEKGLLKNIKYYYNQELKADEDDENSIKGKPRVEIVFNNYETSVKFNPEVDFSEKKYFKEENNKILLKDNYKKFEVKDYRFTVKK